MNLVSHRSLLSIQVIAVLLAMVQGHQRLFPTEVVHRRIPPAHGLTTNHAGASRSFILGLTYESTVPKSPKTPEESSSHLGLCHQNSPGFTSPGPRRDRLMVGVQKKASSFKDIPRESQAGSLLPGPALTFLNLKYSA